MRAKEWLFEKHPEVKCEWGRTGHDDNYMVRMMEEYLQDHMSIWGILDENEDVDDNNDYPTDEWL